MNRLAPRLTAAFLLFTLAVPGFAQFGGGMGGGMGGRRGSGGGGSNAANPRNDTFSSPTTLASAASSRLYDLRVRLMITKEQSPQWDAFESKVWDLLMHNALRAPAGSEGTAAQVVRARANRSQSSAQQWTALADAVDHLYDALSPEQRQVADQELLAVLPGGAAGSESEPGSSSGGSGPRGRSGALP